MIVRMKKVTLLVAEKHTLDSLRELRRLGLVHIKHFKEPVAEDISSLEHKINSCEQALGILGEGKSKQDQSFSEDSNALAQEIVSLHEEEDQVLKEKSELQEKIAFFDQWGELSLTSLKTLNEAGIFVKLYRADAKVLKSIPENTLIHIVRKTKGVVLLASIGVDRDLCFDAQEVKIPDEELISLNVKTEALTRRAVEIKERLHELKGFRHHLRDYKKKISHQLEFSKVRSGMGQEVGFGFFQGFCPHESVGLIEDEVSRQGWGLVVEDPDDPQEVPTLIRNPRWIESIKPVFNFMGALPGYKEYDISSWFLIFFSIFFAMLIGDAGYGTLFLMATFIARRRFKNADARPFSLMYILSIATIIWGALSGTWFGVERIAELPGIRTIIIERIYSFADESFSVIMQLCFFIGALHLTIAHSKVAVRFSNRLFALAQVGWISLIWGIYFLVSTLVLDKPFPPAARYLFIAGFTMIVLFSHVQKNFLKGIALSCADLPLKAISAFADTLSYLRLFAIGYASVMIAASFNDLALSVGFSSPLRGFISALILVAGHGLNIILGLMSVLVHGIRLNMLEFSGHLNMEWSGIPYRPFSET